MPVKRRVSKVRPYKITPELLALFVRCEELQPVYLEHSRQRCPTPDNLFRHCAECREYLDGSLKLHCSMLGLYPHEPEVTDRDLDGPADPRLGSTAWNDARPKVLAIRREILAALGRKD